MWWWKRARQGVRTPAPGTTTVTGDPTSQPYIRDAERRRLRRLLHRRAELAYDLGEAERAWEAVNRWTERIDQLEHAIRQAEDDLVLLELPSPPSLPDPLPPVPVEIVEATPGPPAHLVFRIGSERYAWQEEIDWAEGGHQIAPSRLVRFQGNPAALVPYDDEHPMHAVLVERLTSSLDQLAEDVLAARTTGRPLASLTLTELAKPCPGCGGWQDVRGRCPTCTARGWQKQQLQAQVRRLRAERDQTLADLQRARDRLPVIRRQLFEVDAEIAALRAKGVEPD